MLCSAVLKCVTDPPLSSDCVLLYPCYLHCCAGGVFTNLAHLGWNPREGQMKKQGNWWLQGLVHYDYQGEVLLLHRVTGEVHVPAGHAPRVSPADIKLCGTCVLCIQSCDWRQTKLHLLQAR
jgi:hypothetical protein